MDDGTWNEQDTKPWTNHISHSKTDTKVQENTVGYRQENQVHRENKAALLGHRTDVQGHPLELGEETQVLHTESVEVRCRSPL